MYSRMFINQLKIKYKEAFKLAKKNKKKIAFTIGNTAKLEKSNYFFTPIRISEKLIIFGIVVFSEKIVLEACKFLDGKIDIVFADSEKKIFPKKNGAPGNIERRVRENIKHTKVFTFKGNDLTVDAINLLVDQYFNYDLRGVAGKKIGIIGAGNIGSKVALYLTEKGAKVFLNRRNLSKLKKISTAINLIKPSNTNEKAKISSKIRLSKNADVLIGSTDGIPVITKEMVQVLKPESIIIDSGKGTLKNDAITCANERKIKIFRVDIFPSLEGLISKSISMEKQIKKYKKFKTIKNITIINTGKLGKYGDVVVDDVDKPNIVYGICNGRGDFIRKVPKKYRKFINKFKIN
tara:strand:+ start:25715 stop:26761 length:1047 start_codon:yes stop_codon:yes gene_type:complete